MQDRLGIQNDWIVFYWEPVEDLPPFKLRKDFVGVILGAHVDARHPFLLLVADGVDRNIPPVRQKRLQGEQMGWNVSPTVQRQARVEMYVKPKRPKLEREREREGEYAKGCEEQVGTRR
jgi:hypothetical protein